MKFVIKIEYFLNKLIIAILDAISSGVSKSTPKSIKSFLTKSQNNAYAKRKLIQEKIEKNIESSKQWSKKKIIQTKDLADKTKKNTITKVNQAKSYDWKSLNTSKILAIFSALIAPLAVRAKIWSTTLKPSTLLGVTVTGMALSLSSITIYQQTQKIKEKVDEGVVREPASYKDSMDRNAWKRSEYRNFKDRVLSVGSVSMPIYIQNRKGMQSVKIDFTFVSSNRYISQYFKIMENEYSLRDKINKSVEPVIPSFPMEPEGKRIIKAKIKAEMNDLLKEKGIEGKIEDVFIDSILNG